MCAGYQFYQIAIALLVFGQQHKAIHLLLGAAVGNITVYHVGFATNNGFDARLFGRVVKFYRAVHYAVVGNGTGGEVALFGNLYQVINMRGTIQQAKVRVQI